MKLAMELVGPHGDNFKSSAGPKEIGKKKFVGRETSFFGKCEEKGLEGWHSVFLSNMSYCSPWREKSAGLEGSLVRPSRAFVRLFIMDIRVPICLE